MLYRALLVGVSNYEHLAPLRGPAEDIAVIQRAITDRRTGMFLPENVEEISNPSKAEFEERLSGFLLDRSQPDDLSLVYFAGHGKLTSERALCLCSTDTREGRYVTTGTIAPAVRSLVRDSRSTTIVLILDCCHSGAYSERGGSAGISEEEVLQLIPNLHRKSRGVFVLASTRTLHGAADVDNWGRASPFATILARTLTTPPYGSSAFVTLDDVFDVLDEELSIQGQFPQRVVGEGVVLLARRPPAGSALAEQLNRVNREYLDLQMEQVREMAQAREMEQARDRVDEDFAEEAEPSVPPPPPPPPPMTSPLHDAPSARRVYLSESELEEALKAREKSLSELRGKMRKRD